MPLNLYGAYRHIRPNTCPCWARLSCHLNISNPSSWCCNKTITSGSLWQCSICMLVWVYRHVHKSLNSQTINFHQAYVIILTQRLNNCTICLKVTRQWPLAAARNNLVVVEQQFHSSDIQARCSSKHPPLGFSNPNQLDTTRLVLATASALNTTSSLNIKVRKTELTHCS